LYLNIVKLFFKVNRTSKIKGYSIDSSTSMTIWLRIRKEWSNYLLAERQK